MFIKNAAIVKSLNGSSDSVTNSVNISHIPTLHGCLLESIFDLVEQVCIYKYGHCM